MCYSIQELFYCSTLRTLVYNKKGKVKSATEFAESMKKVHEEAGVALKKTQKEMKRYVDQNRKETE